MSTTEVHLYGVADFSSRAELACATVVACDAYLAAVLLYNEALDRGDVVDQAGKVRLLTDGGMFGEFIAAWRRGTTVADNLRVAEVAVHGYVDEFECPKDARPKIEQWLLDAVVGPMRRLPEPRALAEHSLTQPVMGNLADRLAALQDSLQAEGGDGTGQRTQTAIQAVRESISGALERGVDPETMQDVLDWWHAATGGPKINLAEAPPAAG